MKKWKIIKYFYADVEKTSTLFFAALFGFLQSFSASIMILLGNKDSLAFQFIAGIVYYSVLTVNTQRMAFGTKLGIIIFVISAALGFSIGSEILKLI